MPTTFGFAKFSAPGTLEFYLDIEDSDNEETRQLITVEIIDTEDLRPLCLAINTVSDKTHIHAELKNILTSQGETIKTCILSSTNADSIALEYLSKTPNHLHFSLIDPNSTIESKITKDTSDSILAIKNTDQELIITEHEYEVVLTPAEDTIYASRNYSASLSSSSDSETRLIGPRKNSIFKILFRPVSSNLINTQDNTYNDSPRTP